MSFEYGRNGNPTKVVIEMKISALEGAESTMILASGMCASTVLLMALVPAGGHIVTTTDCYRRTRIFIETILPKMGISVRAGCISGSMKLVSESRTLHHVSGGALNPVAHAYYRGLPRLAILNVSLPRGR